MVRCPYYRQFCHFFYTIGWFTKVGNSIYIYLKVKLHLPINKEKGRIRRPVNFTLLGFVFVPTYVKGKKGKCQLIVSEKS